LREIGREAEAGDDDAEADDDEDEVEEASEEKPELLVRAEVRGRAEQTYVPAWRSVAQDTIRRKRRWSRSIRTSGSRLASSPWNENSTNGSGPETVHCSSAWEQLATNEGLATCSSTRTSLASVSGGVIHAVFVVVVMSRKTVRDIAMGIGDEKRKERK
jgi:hypothetical protein